MTTFTNDQIALEAHIEAQNAQWVAQCEENGATFYTTTVADPAHWEEYGITTIAQYERHCLISSIWDGYKELNGFRPRFMNLDDMSMDQLRKLEAGIYDDMDREREWEESAEEREAIRMNDTIDLMISHGAPDVATAQRWMGDAV